MTERCREPDRHESLPRFSRAQHDHRPGDIDGTNTGIRGQDRAQEHSNGTVARVTRGGSNAAALKTRGDLLGSFPQRCQQGSRVVSKIPPLT